MTIEARGRPIRFRAVHDDGAAEVRAVFPRLSVRNLRSHLTVTDVDAVVSYVQSVLPEERPSACDALREHVTQVIALHGHFHVSCWVGLFVAEKE